MESQGTCVGCKKRLKIKNNPLDFVRITEKNACDNQKQYMFYLIIDFGLWLERKKKYDYECVMYCDFRILLKN